MISNPFFLDFSTVLPEDCLIIPSPSSPYRPMLDGLTIGDILLRINDPTMSHTSAPWKEPVAISKLSVLFNFVQVLLS